MPREEDHLAPTHDLPGVLKKVRERTPARLLAGRSGSAYRTNTQLELREAHAAARDAVRAEMNLSVDLGESFVQEWNLFEVCSQAATKDEYLLRPGLGRQLNDASRAEVLKRCVAEVDLQIVIGDGLSVTAIAAQVPQLLPRLAQGAKDRGWSVGSVISPAVSSRL